MSVIKKCTTGLLSALALCAAVAAVPGAASAVWNDSPWKQGNHSQSEQDFTVNPPIIREIDIFTKWNSTSNRTISTTNNTFHAVSNFCVSQSTGSGFSMTSHFVGPFAGTGVVFSCSAGSVPEWSKGWIWTD